MLSAHMQRGEANQAPAPVCARPAQIGNLARPLLSAEYLGVSRSHCLFSAHLGVLPWGWVRGAPSVPYTMLCALDPAAAERSGCVLAGQRVAAGGAHSCALALQ